MEETTNYLQDLEQEINLEPATSGTRFLNLIIDSVVYYALSFVAGIVYGLYLATSGGQLDEGGTGQLTIIVIALVPYILYYSLMEAFAGGRTLGKMATGTYAVQTNGEPVTFGKALLRTVIRFIPFEPFSILAGRPWHDSWTDTVVAKKNR